MATSVPVLWSTAKVGMNCGRLPSEKLSLALSLLSLRGLLQLVPLLSEVSKYTSVLVPVFAV